MRRMVSFLAALAIQLGSAGLARADVPPPNECGTAGEDCENAPPDYHSPGTCTKSSCSRPSPTGETNVYECNVCVASDRSRKKKGLLGCTVAAPGAANQTDGAAWLLLAALGLRRRASSRRPAPN